MFLTRLSARLMFCWSLGMLPAGAQSPPQNPQPRAGWVFVPGSEDLVDTGFWDCLSGVTAAAGSIAITAGTGYNTAVNYGGPDLMLNGDFSVVATLLPSASGSAGNAALTLVGMQNTGSAFYQGLKRIDATGTGATYWTGDSATGTAVPYAAGTSAPAGAFTVEIARIGALIAINLNGAQVAAFADPGLFAPGKAYLGFNVAPNLTLTVTSLAATMPAGGATSLNTPFLAMAARTGSGLRDVATNDNVLMGAAVNPSDFSDAAYLQAIGREYDLVVAENAFKFAETETAPHVFSFCMADQIVAYAAANGMRVRGHNLVWSMDLPDWLVNGGYTSAQAAAILEEHIETVLAHFQGKAIDWDVVNESLSYSPPYGPMASYWLTQLGSNYVAQAYQWAHAADPNMKLFYNDTGGEGLGAKSDAIYNLVKGLVETGVPLDGVGLEMHVDVPTAPSEADVAANMARLAALGLEVHISEMDVRIPVDANGNASAADLAAQATVYQNMMMACRANANCTEFLTWGVTDNYSWIPGNYPGEGAALLLDTNYQPKPAYTAVKNVLSMTATPAAPAIGIGGVVIHGGTAAVLSPGSLVDIYGTNLSANAMLAGSVPLGTALAGTQVMVDGAPVPVLYVSPLQVIFQLPYEAAPGPVLVQVVSGGAVSQGAAITVATAAPVILTYGNNLAVVENQDYSVNSPSNCAAPGSYMTAYLIGTGPLDHSIATGAAAAASPLSREVLNTTATVGTAAATVSFAGMTPGAVGLMQVNFQAPNVSGNLPLTITIGTAISNTPYVCVGS